MRPFYSQHGEDRWIVAQLELPEQGVFVEVGAADGILHSNTKYFEDQLWAGLCIEPHPRLYGQLVKNRKCTTMNCAITSNTKSSQPFYFDMGTDTWSGFHSQAHRRAPAQVLLKRLDQALNEVGIDRIDILSIDTEGSELDAWASFDHNIWQPRIVIIEWETQGVLNTEQTIRETFSTLPYRLVLRTIGNLIYERTGT